MTAAILAMLLRGNLAVSAAILVILLLRRPIRRRFGAAASYSLWLAAPLCLLAALAPPSAPAGLVAPVIADLAAATGAPPRLPSPVDWRPALAAVWLLGALATAGLFALRQARFVRALGRLTPWTQDRSVLVGQSADAGPLVLGLLRPRIVLPADFETRFDGEARALVLAHERVHLTRGDAAVNGLTVAAQCLAWFNPLIHLAARALRVDQEIACDAAVLAARPHARRLYAETLIGALTPMSAPLACHWPAVGVHPLKERLVMMSSVSVSRRRQALGLGLVAALGLAGAGAVWAANPAPAEVIRQPNWLSKPTGADLVRFYPAEAAKTRTSGEALIACSVAASGRLQDCSIVTEAPAAAGFGQAALKLSETFQMSPRSQDGKPTAGGSVRIPIRFALAPTPQP